MGYLKYFKEKYTNYNGLKSVNDVGQYLDHFEGKSGFDVFSPDAEYSTGNFSNFRILGIGKLSKKQKENREEKEERKDTKKTYKIEKAKEKALLRQKYGKGADYRKAKAKVKAELKDEKKAIIKEHGGTFAGRMLRGFLKYFPVTLASRNAYLGLIRLNFWNKARKLSQVKNNAIQGKPKSKTAIRKVESFWKGIGGDTDSLYKAVDAGKGKKPLQVKINKKQGTDGRIYYESYCYPTGVEESAGVTLASAIIIAISEILKPTDDESEPLTTDEQDYNNIYEMADDYLKQAEGMGREEFEKQIMADPKLTEAQKIAILDAYEEEYGKKGLPLWAYIAIGVTTSFVIAGGIYLIVKAVRK